MSKNDGLFIYDAFTDVDDVITMNLPAGNHTLQATVPFMNLGTSRVSVGCKFDFESADDVAGGVASVEPNEIVTVPVTNAVRLASAGTVTLTCRLTSSGPTVNLLRLHKARVTAIRVHTLNGSA